jgi:hypothetical protein
MGLLYATKIPVFTLEIRASCLSGTERHNVTPMIMGQSPGSRDLKTDGQHLRRGGRSDQ